VLHQLSIKENLVVMVTSVLYKSETFTEIFCFRIIIICIYECFLFQILKKKNI